MFMAQSILLIVIEETSVSLMQNKQSAVEAAISDVVLWSMELRKHLGQNYKEVFSSGEMRE